MDKNRFYSHVICSYNE